MERKTYECNIDDGVCTSCGATGPAGCPNRQGIELHRTTLTKPKTVGYN